MNNKPTVALLHRLLLVTTACASAAGALKLAPLRADERAHVGAGQTGSAKLALGGASGSSA